jgi:hypothetical protein
MLTDCAATAQWSTDHGFEESHLIEAAEDADPLASALEETLSAQLFASVLERLETLSNEPAVLWVHSTSLTKRWDAPAEFRDNDDLVCEEEGVCETCPDPIEVAWQEAHPDDAPPRDWTSLEAARLASLPPQCTLPEDADPDLLLAWMTAYGAQVRVLDSLLGVLHGTLSEAIGKGKAHFVMTGTSGFALGEHGVLGPSAGPPRSNRIQVPLLISLGNHSACRVLTPVSLKSLRVTLNNLVHHEPLNRSRADATSPFQGPWDESDPLLTLASAWQWAEPRESFAPVVYTEVAESAGEITLCTTPGWFLVAHSDGSRRLYLKPDDRHDFNDVAGLEPDVLERFEADL